MVSIAFMESGLKLIELLYNIYVLSEGRCGYYDFNFYHRFLCASVAVWCQLFLEKLLVEKLNREILKFLGLGTGTGDAACRFVVSRNSLGNSRIASGKFSDFRLSRQTQLYRLQRTYFQTVGHNFSLRLSGH